jgi:undecaprenyl-diphosphatase
MWDNLKALDETLFLFLNARHSPLFDYLMWLFSDKLFWLPLYVWFLWILYRHFPKHYWTILVSVTLMIVVSDQFCNLVKDSTLRLRPSQEPHLQAMVHIVNNYRGGTYGFYSSHASNSFALAFFLIILASRKHVYVIPISLLYALLTSYSRIYLGVHYPGDILAGAIMGILIGTGFAVAHNKLRTRFLTTNT